MTAFRFQISMANYSRTEAHREISSDLRAIADRWPEFNVTVYQWFFAFAEQFSIITPTLITNVLIALACMVLVSLVMIPSIGCSILIALAIISIDVGERLWSNSPPQVTHLRRCWLYVLVERELRRHFYGLYCYVNRLRSRLDCAC